MSAEGPVFPSDGITPWPRVVRELAVTLLAVGAYLLLRGAAGPDNPAAALQRADDIIAFEQQLGVFHEAAWQKAMLPHRALVETANAIYLFGMHPVMLFTAIWLCRRNLPRFRLVQKVLLTSAVLGCLCYALLPTAPPRLVETVPANTLFVDTLHGETSASVQDLQPPILVNDYAAIPSYHFAWIVLMAASIWATTRNVAARVAAGLFTVAMGWAIVATGNHFFFDAAAGAVVVGIGFLVARAIARDAQPSRQLQAVTA